MGSLPGVWCFMGMGRTNVTQSGAKQAKVASQRTDLLKGLNYREVQSDQIFRYHATVYAGLSRYIRRH